MASQALKKQPEGQKKGKLGSDAGSISKGPEDRPLAFVGEMKQVARWEKQWVAIQNVIEFGPEILVKKWVLVHDSDENRRRSNSHSQYSEFSAHESVEEKAPKKSRKDLSKRYVCQFANCGKIFFDSSTFALK